MQQPLIRTPAPVWPWSVGAFGLVFAATFVSQIGAVILAPLAALLVGGAAAYWSTCDSDDTLGRSVAFGAIAGVGALLAGVVAYALIGFGLGSQPEIQALVQASTPHPEARLPADWISPLGAALGAFVGLGAGLTNLALATIGGLLAGLFRGGAGAPPHAAGTGALAASPGGGPRPAPGKRCRNGR